MFSIYYQIQQDIEILKKSSPVHLHNSGSSYIPACCLEGTPVVDTFTSDSDVDILDMPIPIKSSNKAPSIRSRCSLITGTSIQNSPIDETVKLFFIKEREESIGDNCACTNTQKLDVLGSENKYEGMDYPEYITDYAEFVNWSEFITKDIDNFEIDIFWNNYKQEKGCNSSHTYMEKLELIKSENNTMKRVSWFVRVYINHLGRIPTVEEVEIEYIARGLNRNSQSSTLNRRKRIKGAIEYYSKEYDVSQTGFKLNWSEEKARIVTCIQPYLPDNLSYRQGKRFRNISSEDIGFVYFVIYQMENSKQNRVLSNSLSYNQMDELFLSVFGNKCGRHKFSAILKRLLDYGLIEKVANYKVGLRGNCYVAKVNLGSV